MHSCTCIIDPTVGSLVKEITSEDLYLLHKQISVFEGRDVIWVSRTTKYITILEMEGQVAFVISKTSEEKQKREVLPFL